MSAGPRAGAADADGPISVSAEGGARPTPTQELLLDAALGDAPTAERGWRAWLDATGFDDVDAGSLRLLPLVHHHLGELGLLDAVPEAAGRLRGVARLGWYESRMARHRQLPALRLLRGHGIVVVVLKGAALDTRWAPRQGLRPSSDLDLLVPEGRAEDALRLLLGDRWRATVPILLPAPYGSLPPALRRCRHAISLTSADDAQLDLHWHVTPLCQWEGADRLFWDHTVPLELDGVVASTLDATGHLVHAVLHGMTYNPVPPLRWVADAASLLRSGEVDWPRVVRMGHELRVQQPLAAALAYLGVNQHRWALGPVPQWAADELGAAGVGRLDRALFARLAKPPAECSVVEKSAATTARYVRSLRGAGPVRTVTGLPGYLQHWLVVDDARRLPWEVVRRLAGGESRLAQFMAAQRAAAEPRHPRSALA